MDNMWGGNLVNIPDVKNIPNETTFYSKVDMTLWKKGDSVLLVIAERKLSDIWFDIFSGSIFLYLNPTQYSGQRCDEENPLKIQFSAHLLNF